MAEPRPASLTHVSMTCFTCLLAVQLVFDAMRVSSGNSFCWETEVPRMLKGDYYPDFTAEMMHKDISLGLALGERYGVPMPTNAFVAAKYEEAMEKHVFFSNQGWPSVLYLYSRIIRPSTNSL
jgi:3-hydroxyisobutyrate dehydrogenase-like beta-hydroxyacid dehydrogenase